MCWVCMLVPCMLLAMLLDGSRSHYQACMQVLYLRLFDDMNSCPIWKNQGQIPDLWR